MNVLAEVSGLHKTFPNTPTPAVTDISFQLRQGEIIALLGPNGAGKTTTIKMLLGLITPTSGQACIHGFDMSVEAQRTQGIQHVGAVLEGARNSYWRLTGRENLHYFAGLKDIPHRQAKQKADALLEMLGLADAAEKEVRYYSRGMQQKLAIGIALLSDPDVLLLDEPTLGLDIQAARLLEEQITVLAAEGRTILLTTHTMALAEKLASRIVVINQGREVANATKRELVAQFGRNEITDITIDGRMETQHILQAFPNVEMTESTETTHLTWRNATQPQLFALLAQLEANHVSVRHFERREPTLEEIFVSLTQADA